MKAASVFPDPVGATMSVCSPREMWGQPSTCGGVGRSKARANQSATTGWKGARASGAGAVLTVRTVSRAAEGDGPARVDFTPVGSDVLTPPKERASGPGAGAHLGRPCSVIVLNDSHNTFEGVATILSQFVPGVDHAKGMAFAKTIHTKGQATVWRGDHERAELVWEQLKDAGLTMAPLTDG